MHTTILALSVAASIPLINAYPITTSGLNCRSGPGTSYDVVKTYDLGEDVSITCQAPGTDIYGDELWDLTSDGCYVTDYYVSTGTSSYVTSPCDGGDSGSSGSDGDLPGLDSTQSAHARDIIAEAQAEGLGHQGCTAGIATALVEVRSTQVLHSPRMSYPHKTSTNTINPVQHSHLRQQRRPRVPKLPLRCRGLRL